jgi:aspartate 1-decarboxylase
MCKSKISNAVVTGKELYYEGSITIDGSIIEKVDIAPGEMVDVLNLNSGARITTYIISGKRGSGDICLNGPASRFFEIGDIVIILSNCIVDEGERRNWKIKTVKLQDNNKNFI